MKRVSLLICLSAMALGLPAYATEAVPYTSLAYDVFYHMGFINKEAGTAYVDYHTSGDSFIARLGGHSIPWGDKIYTIQSSLTASFGTPDKNGVSTETVEEIQGVYSKPKYGENPVGTPFRTIAGYGTLNASPQTMEAVTVLSDMLSLFYYARQLNFASMEPGTRLVIPVINEGENQPLYITYNGETRYVSGDFDSEVYSIVFQYTYEGAPDSYPVTCLISADNRVPVFFSTDLLIGHVEMRIVA